MIRTKITSKPFIAFKNEGLQAEKISKFYGALHNKKNENQEVLKKYLQGMPKFKPKKTKFKPRILFEEIGRNTAAAICLSLIDCLLVLTSIS